MDYQHVIHKQLFRLNFLSVSVFAVIIYVWKILDNIV